MSHSPRPSWTNLHRISAVSPGLISKRRRRLKLGGAFLLLGLIFFLPFAAAGQKGTHYTKRVKFAPGQTSTVIKGRANWGASYIYLLRARAGQNLSVKIEGVPVLRVVPPKARDYEALEGADTVKQWSGRLPMTGDYQINVGHADDNYTEAPFTLRITVE